jgi:hypothetical protein
VCIGLAFFALTRPQRQLLGCNSMEELEARHGEREFGQKTIALDGLYRSAGSKTEREHQREQQHGTKTSGPGQGQYENCWRRRCCLPISSEPGHANNQSMNSHRR